MNVTVVTSAVQGMLCLIGVQECKHQAELTLN